MNYPYEIQRKLKFAPNPTYEFQFGDTVEKDGIYDAMILSVSNDKMVYEISYSEGKERNGIITLTNTGLKMFVLWYEIRKPNKNTKSIVKNEFLRFHFELQTIQSVLDRILFFGCNFETDYRIKHTWSNKKKESYIASVFENIDLGTFKMIPSFNGKMYECIDGAERLKVLLDFYTDNLNYLGKKFSDLTKKDKDFFLNKFIQVADLDYKTTEEDIKQHYFLSNKIRLI